VSCHSGADISCLLLFALSCAVVAIALYQALAVNGHSSVAVKEHACSGERRALAV
jgi:hypothetical protein